MRNIIGASCSPPEALDLIAGELRELMLSVRYPMRRNDLDALRGNIEARLISIRHVAGYLRDTETGKRPGTRRGAG